MIELTLQKITAILKQADCQVSPATDTEKHTAPKNTILVTTSVHFGLWITVEEDRLRFCTFYSGTEYAKTHPAQFLYLINSFNETSDVTKYFVSLDSNVTASAYLYGAFNQGVFVRLFLCWADDVRAFKELTGISEFIM